MITKDSESSNDIAIPAYVPNNLENVLCGYHSALIRPNPDEIDGKFLLRALQSKTIRYQLEVEATGITRYGIDQYAIGSAFFPVPPISEQRTIATYLDHQTAKIDALISNNTTAKEIVNEYPYLEEDDIRQSLQYAAWLADKTVQVLEMTA